MLDLGFREDLEFILDATPPERRTLLFSATIRATSPPWRASSSATRFASTRWRRTSRMATSNIGRSASRPTRSSMRSSTCCASMRCAPRMVFCHTREAVRHLQASLLERGFSAVALSGELTPERAQPCPAIAARRTLARLRRDGRRGARHRPAGSRPRHSRRTAERSRDAAASLRSYGPRRPQGHLRAARALYPPPQGRRLVQAAGVDAEWAGPPSAEDIRQRDRERVMQDPAFSEEANEEDVAMGKALLAERTPEEIATAFARFHRARLPAPEEMVDVGTDRAPRERLDKRGPRRRARPPSEHAQVAMKASPAARRWCGSA